MTLNYSIVVVKEGREFWSYIPDLPGVYGRGKTSAQSKKDLRAALELCIEDCQADGDPLPKSAATIVEVDRLALKA